MSQIPGLYILHNGNKGRGVFTSRPISEGDVIEVCHTIILFPSELSIIHKTSLHDYYFLWGANLDQCAIALGYGSLYNHALNGNAEFILDFDQNTIDFVAICDIEAGEEITVNYHGENGDDTPLWWQNQNKLVK